MPGPVLAGSAGTDVLVGGDGDDVFMPGAGRNTIAGGAGFDTVRLSGHAADYTMKVVDGTLLVSGAGGASYALRDIESFEFLGGRGNSAADSASLLYQSILGRDGNVFEIDFWAGVIAGGMSVHGVAEQFISSPEAAGIYRTSGSAGFVTALYESILSRAPSADEVDHWVGKIATGADRT